MSNGNNPARNSLRYAPVIPAAVLLGLCWVAALSAQAQVPTLQIATAVSAAPTPIPAAPVQEIEAEKTELPDTPEEGNSFDPRLEAVELLEVLRSGNNGQPLTVAQLAAINDTLKRLEYIKEIEGKMNEMSLGEGASTSASAVPSAAISTAPLNFSSAAQNMPTVVRIVGSKGVYSALLAVGSNVIPIREGDNTELGLVTRISMQGVQISGDGKSLTLPFRNTKLP